MIFKKVIYLEDSLGFKAIGDNCRTSVHREKWCYAFNPSNEILSSRKENTAVGCIYSRAIHLLGSQATTREKTHDVGLAKTFATILQPFIWSSALLCFGPSSGTSSQFFSRSSASVVYPKMTKI